MSWGSEAEVLETPELRTYVAEEVRKIAGLNDRRAQLMVLRDAVSDTT
jgi:hypothetical protein